MLASLAMKPPLFSLRMHASRKKAHLSGAERLLPEEQVAAAAAELVERALGHVAGRAEQVRLSLDLVDPGTVRYLPLPDFQPFSVADADAGRRAAALLLQRCGVSAQAAGTALASLAAGAAPGGGNMRGAMLVNARSGARLEADPARGVRASRMDLTPAAGGRLAELLRPLGLDNPHVREALVLAGKVASAPGVLAELCWSDDPDYVAGYVCSKNFGYQRLSALKEVGDGRGGRAFFLAPGTALEDLITYLETAPILFDRVGILHPPHDWSSYAATLAAGT